jgi:hypothetical protein
VSELTHVMEYVRANPGYGAGAAFAVVAIYYLLNRKSRLVRDADRRMTELQGERSDQYKKLRPLR